MANGSTIIHVPSGLSIGGREQLPFRVSHVVQTVEEGHKIIGPG